MSTALTSFFFGPNLDQKLKVEKFLDFQRQLQREMIWLEVRILSKQRTASLK